MGSFSMFPHVSSLIIKKICNTAHVLLMPREMDRSVHAKRDAGSGDHIWPYYIIPNDSFASNVDRVLARSIAILGFLIRSLKEFIDPYTSKALYCAFVRPILDYASVVWSITYTIHVRRIKFLQKRFLLFALRHLSPGTIFSTAALQRQTPTATSCKILFLHI